ncbi:hypothetical protein GCM10010401_07410 [Rarobacter faecitabidus]|uniref:phage tail tube protein n=1 Tax=Rarobacter faecitabidus TaxID=13243 RepID=UPI0031CED97C
MAGVKTLADGNPRVKILPAKPVDKNAITLTEANAATAKYASSRILFSDFDLGPTGSETVDEKPLDATGNAQSFGLSNYGGGFTVLRFFDPATKIADDDDDWLYELVKEKGTVLHVYVRDTAKLATEVDAVGDEYSYYEVIVDDLVRGDRTGYIKYRVACAVQDAALQRKVVAGA